jgi:hypothetical protein
VLHFILPFRPVESDAEAPAAVLNDADADAAPA